MVLMALLLLVLVLLAPTVWYQQNQYTDFTAILSLIVLVLIALVLISLVLMALMLTALHYVYFVQY